MTPPARLSRALPALAARHWPLIVLLALNAATHAIWLGFHGGIQTAGDTGVFPHAAQLQLNQNALSIQTGTGLSSTDLTTSYHPLLVVFSLLAHLGVGYGWSLRLLYLWPFLVLSSTGAYTLGRQLLRSGPGVLVAGLVLQFNTYILLLQGGELTLLMGGALLVCLTSAFLRLTRSAADPWLLVRIAVTGFALSVYELRIFYIAALLLAFVGVFYALWQRSWKAPLWWCAMMSVVVGLNAYWLLALGQSGSLTNNALTGRGLFGPEFFNFSSSLALFHRFWTGSATAVFIDQPLPDYFWLIPLVAALGLIATRKRPDIWLFAVIAIVGVFLSKETNPPFGGVYSFLFNNFPGFSLFREAGKFYLLTAVGYAILIGSAADWTWRHRRPGDLRTAAAIFAICWMGMLFLFNAKPLVSGSFDTMFKTRTRPAAYQAVDRLTYPDPASFRTMWVPASSRWSPYDTAHPSLSFGDAIAAWSGVDIGGATLSNEPTPLAQLNRLVTTDVGHDLLDESSVRFVAVPVLDSANSDDVFGGVDRSAYIATLEQSPWLHELKLSGSSIAVFENDSWKPELNAPNITSRQLSLSSYDATISHVAGPTNVNLSLASDTGWRIVPAALPADNICPGIEWRTVAQTHSVLGSRTVVGHTGETIQAIAGAADASVTELIQANHLNASPTSALRFPQRLVIPAQPVETTQMASCSFAGRQATSVGLSVSGLLPNRAANPDSSWLTSWTLTPSQIRGWPANSWKSEPDGSLDVAFTVEYAPQAAFDRGLIVSLAGFVILLTSCLLLAIFRSQRHVAAFLATATSEGSARSREHAPSKAPSHATPPLTTRVGLSRVSSVLLDCLSAVFSNALGLTHRARRMRLRLKGATVGERTTIGRKLTVVQGRNVRIGSDVRIGSSCVLSAAGEINIENDCIIGNGVNATATGDQPIHVETGVVIGSGALLRPGSRVSAGVRVAASSIVESRDSPFARGLSAAEGAMPEPDDSR